MTEARLAEQRCAVQVQTAMDTLASSEHIVEQRRLDHPSVAARVCHLEAVRDAQRAALEALRLHQRRREELQRSLEVLDETLERAGFPAVDVAEAGLLDRAGSRGGPGMTPSPMWSGRCGIWQTSTSTMQWILRRSAGNVCCGHRPRAQGCSPGQRPAGPARARPARREQLQARVEHAVQVRADTEPVIGWRTCHRAAS